MFIFLIKRSSFGERCGTQQQTKFQSINKAMSKPHYHSHSGLSRKKDASKSAHTELGWRAKEKLRKDTHSNNRKHCNRLVLKMYLLLFYFFLCAIMHSVIKPPVARKPTV